MDPAGVLLLRSRPADDGPQRNDGGTVGDLLSFIQCMIQGLDVFDVGAIILEPVNALDMPAVGFVARQNVLVKRDICVVFNRDVVVIVNNRQVAQALRSGQ